MNEDTITIEVDGKLLPARKGQMLIEVTDANDIYVPRFCYHNKLSVAANCRMCLVEVEKAPKPLPACATPVMDGMKAYTKSTLAVDAQKSVMEFLLINHPLDCPICDQGGECELQDLAMGYGRDVSRYQEKKRVVKDKNIGPLVQTDMTRCIHCTRCVRFGEEIAGMRELGGTGRSEHMEIGTYIEKSMTSELSGNIIDLCPVGALTSKPFRFSARTWEMRQYNGIAPHDAVGSNIHIHVKGNRVKRIVPAVNESINEVWLSDRDRFSYEGLYSNDRLLTPLLKQGNEWQEVDWTTAFRKIKDRLGKIITSAGAEKIGALASATCTTEELYLLQKFMRGIGSNNIDHRVHQYDFSDQEQAPGFPWLGQAITDLEQLDAGLIVGSNVRKEQPLINHRLRKAALKGASLMVVNSVDYEFNYDLTDKLIISPEQFTEHLAGIAKVMLVQNKNSKDLHQLVKDVQVNAIHESIAEKLKSADKGTVLLGSLVSSTPQFSVIRYLAGMIAQLAGVKFGYLAEAANTSGAWLVGAVPHRQPGGVPVKHNNGLHAYAMFENQLQAYCILNLEPELDCWNGPLARRVLAAADYVIAMTPYKTSAMDHYADVLLPISQFMENEGTYINMEGVYQQFSNVVVPPGESRPGWKILRVLGNNFELSGFDYNTVDEVRTEWQEAVANINPENNGAWLKPASLPKINGSLQRITERPMNSVDALARRASALQQTVDVADGAIHINSVTILEMGLSTETKVQVKQDEVEIELPLVIDDRLPVHTVLIQAAHPHNHGLGPWFGDISVVKNV